MSISPNSFSSLNLHGHRVSSKIFIDMSKKILHSWGIESNNIKTPKKKEKKPLAVRPSLMFHQDLPAVLLKINFPHAQCAFHFIFFKLRGGFGGSLRAPGKQKQATRDRSMILIRSLDLFTKDLGSAGLLVKAFGY